MAKRSGKRTLSCFSKKSRSPKRTELQPMPSPPAAKSGGNWAVDAPSAATTPAAGQKSSKKKTGPRLWIRFDRTGQSEILECDKSAIIRRASIPARDLRILGPVFSHSANILAREKAMVVNLEFIKAIVTAEEVLVLDPLCQEVLPFIDQLRQQLPLKSPFRFHEPGHTEIQSKEMFSTGGQWLHGNEAAEGECELPFEFQVLEVALEVVCTYLESSVADLERNAYPVLDELAMNVSTKNLERVRSLKSNITRLLARVQKVPKVKLSNLHEAINMLTGWVKQVRDEIEHLLDDNEDMAHLYLTRRQIQYQHFEALIASGASNSIVAAGPNLSRHGSNIHGSSSIVTSFYSDDNDVEDLEMLLEAYFMQLDGTRNKILSVREYIDDTEDYVNIQLDNQRNELIQLQLILTIVMFAIAINTLIVGAFAMNIPCPLYQTTNLFWPFVGGTTGGCLLIMVLFLAYARWKKLIGP